MSKKSFIDSVEVKSPCSEDWNKMRGTDKIRFCSHCSTSVNNLSEMTRKQATRLVRASGGKLCIRYIADPKTKRPLFAEQLLQITRRAPSVAAGVMGASIALSSHAYAQESSPVPSPVPAIERLENEKGLKADKPESSNAGRISGTVVDPAGAVVAGASVSIFSVDTAKVAATTSNENGEYTFTNLRAGNYRIETTSPGFRMNVRTVILGESREAVEDTTLDVGGFELVVEVKADLQLDIAQVTMGIVAVVEYSSDLSRAVADEEVDAVRELLIKGAKVNDKEDSYRKITPLFVAVETGNIEIIQLLLDHGAKVNARDAEKQTPIMRLEEDATPELVELLVRYGAKIDVADKSGNTPLILAAASAKVEVVKALIDSGADVRAKNKAGRTALMNAAENDDLEAVRLLLESGSEVNARDDEGESAWDLTSNDEIEELLESYGAETKDDDEAETAEPSAAPSR